MQESTDVSQRAELSHRTHLAAHPLSDKLSTLLTTGQRRRLILVLAGTLIAGGLETVGIGTVPAFVGLLVDPERLIHALPAGFVTEWIRHLEKSWLILYGSTLLTAIFLLKNIYVMALIYAETQLAEGLNASFSNRLFQAYLRSPYTFHLERNPAELIRNLTDEAVYAAQWVRAGMRLVREGLVLACVFLLMVLVEPLVSLMVISLLALTSAGFYLSVRHALLRRGKLCEDHWSRRVQSINQSLGAIKIAKLLGRESYLMESFRKEVEALQRHETFYAVVSALPRQGLEVLAVTVVLPIALAFVFLGRPFTDMLPVLALYGIAVVRLVPAMTAINTSLVDMRYRRPAFDLVSGELKALEGPPAVCASTSSSPVKINTLQDDIRLEKVHYRYPGARTESLAGISLTITAGTAVAVVGPSGAGKSTLIDIMSGLLTPTGGRVLVDGRDIRDDLTAWQRQIGYVPQEIYLLDDSIRRNIAFGLPDDQIDDLAVARAVQAAQLDALVRSLPQGIETSIGHEGIRLSGGQRQRIAIARALYHDPSVLVMDEATNALDQENEREVVEAIGRLRGDRTIIVIAHRLTSTKHCDTVFLLEAGTIRDQGSLAELALRHANLREASVVQFDRPLGVA